MKIVLDTNVWLSGIFWKAQAYNLINYCINKKIEIIISKDILEEITRVASREDKFTKYIKNLNEDMESLVRTILSISRIIETKSHLDIVKADPKDNIILDAALDGKADFIVTYDNHLLNMIEFREIKIIKPEEFMTLMKK